MEPYEFAITVGEASGARLEIAGGIPTWEAFPAFRHQNLVFVFKVRSALRPDTLLTADAFTSPMCTCVSPMVP